VIAVNAHGYAIPINIAKNIAAQLIAKGSAVQPSIGLDARTITPHVASLFRLPVRSGLLVGRVCRSGGAARAGVRGATSSATVAGDTWPLGGDIIVGANGARVGSVEQLHSIVRSEEPGDAVELELYRGAKQLEIEVKLGRQPANPRC
jgi:S1-C subfamily serine protease